MIARSEAKEKPSTGSTWLKVLMDEREEHSKALRVADERFDAERDRRYSEVNIEREKALKIKETADLAALSLAREIQDYKDDKANTLRDRDASERGGYATKEDLASFIDKIEAVIKPLSDFVSGQQGQRVARADQRFDRSEGRASNQWLLGILVALVAVAVALSPHIHLQ